MENPDELAIKQARAWELINRLRDTGFHVSPFLQQEINEICMKDWERELEAESEEHNG